MEHLQKFSSAKEDAQEFPVWESKLVGRLGLSRTFLMKLRDQHLTQGVDWIKKGRRVLLSPVAVDKLRRVMDLPAEKRALEEPYALPAPPERKIYTLKVYRKVISHPNMILATDDVNIFRVRVKTKTHFLPGMEIRCEHDHQDLFNHVGNCPRFRGRY